MSSAENIESHVEETEGSYLASLSDLMVGVLFIFIILLMAFILKYQEATKNNIESTKKNEEIFDSISSLESKRSKLLEMIQSKLKEEGVLVEIDTKNGIMRLPDSLLFDSNSAEIPYEGAIALLTVSKGLAFVLSCNNSKIDNCNNDGNSIYETVLIEGHTDKDKIVSGPFASNLMLSSARAEAVWKKLKEAKTGLGVMKNSKGQTLFGISGYGFMRSLSGDKLAKDYTLEEKKQDRRIDFRFILGQPEHYDASSNDKLNNSK